MCSKYSVSVPDMQETLTKPYKTLVLTRFYKVFLQGAKKRAKNFFSREACGALQAHLRKRPKIFGGVPAAANRWLVFFFVCAGGRIGGCYFFSRALARESGVGIFFFACAGASIGGRYFFSRLKNNTYLHEIKIKYLRKACTRHA